MDTNTYLFVCGIYAFCICGIHSVKDDALLGDGNEGLHKQRIQTRTGQLYLPVQGRFKIQTLRFTFCKFSFQQPPGQSGFGIKA